MYANMPLQPLPINQENPALGTIFNPNVMLGLGLMSAGHSNNPETAIFSALQQMQQAQQYKNQMTMQQLQYNMDLNKFNLSQQEFNLNKKAQQRSQQQFDQSQAAGKDISTIVGEEPSVVNNFQGSGLMQAGNLDPVTQARYNMIKALAQNGKTTEAEALLPDYPKPFTLSDGQTMYGPDGKVIVQGKEDNSKTNLQAYQLRGQFIQDSKTFQDYGDTYARFNNSKQDPINGKDSTKDKTMMTNLIKMTNPNAKVNNGEVIGYENMGTLSDQFKQQYKQILEGGRLTAESRIEMYNQGDQLYQSQLARQNQLMSQYTNIATSQGLDPNNVVIDYRYKFPKSSDNFSENDYIARDKKYNLPPGTSKIQHFLLLQSQSQGPTP